MKIPYPRRLSESDASDPSALAKAWNDFAASIAAALGNGLSINDNFRSQVGPVDVQKSQAYPFKVKSLRGVIIGCRVLNAVDTSSALSPPAAVTVAPQVNFTQDGDQILVNAIGGLDTTKSYRLTIEWVAA